VDRVAASRAHPTLPGHAGQPPSTGFDGDGPRQKDLLSGFASISKPVEQGSPMAKPNYAFAKRQRDLAKKQKKEAKRQRKEAGTPAEPPPTTDSPKPPVDGAQ